MRASGYLVLSGVRRGQSEVLVVEECREWFESKRDQWNAVGKSEVDTEGVLSVFERRIGELS